MSFDWDIVIITADEPYTGLLHTQILYANYLSKSTRVLYYGAPGTWHPLKFFSFINPWKTPSKSLSFKSYANLLPAGFPISSAINEWFNAKIIEKKIRKLKPKKLLVWHFDSYRALLNTSEINKYQTRHLYHVIDPFFKNPLNEKLCLLSQAIVITSPRNNTFYNKYENKIINIGQCLDLRTEEEALLKSKNQKIPENAFFVLLGTISDDLDFDLLFKIAEHYPIYLIGKKLELKKKQEQYNQLLQVKNTIVKGPMQADEFYAYLSKAKAGLICYDRNIRSGNFSPLKALNYLMAGVPVISNCDTEIPVLKNKSIFETTQDVQFLEWCSHAWSEKLVFETELKNSFLKSVSLQNAVEQIMKKMKSNSAEYL